jgi:hypothetical protein
MVAFLFVTYRENRISTGRARVEAAKAEATLLKICNPVPSRIIPSDFSLDLVKSSAIGVSEVHDSDTITYILQSGPPILSHPSQLEGPRRATFQGAPES